ncbi:Type 1 glutamine amidotransferase-like domain-containing protein [Psychrobacillus glaciei]|uniref:Type 1 glutamine amidotransferase-like domain-containing protein n=1 Tax=Psychrobacillus glaciei TaxID=2283160 RepID=UPI001CEFB0A3|nr:Type 1 glutamine amidotransferase-like domain-containing protein [Psychrobacillus glaciei]
MGGGNHLNNELKEVIHQLSNYVMTEHKVLIIPFATEVSKYEGWFKIIEQTFNIIGNKNVELLQFETDAHDMVRKISAHDVLYLIGGRPDLLMQRLHEKNLIPVIKQFQGLIIGYSAGALVLSNDCIISKDGDYPKTNVIKGIGLVDFSIEVHYEPSIDEEIIGLSNKREIYAIPNGSAIFSDGTKIMCINEIYHFSNLKKEKIALL